MMNLSLLRSQDEITFRTGDIQKARILEVGIDVIVYKKFENLNGPSYTIKKDQVFMIKYENGSKDVFEADKPAAKAAGEKTISEIVDEAIDAAIATPPGGAPAVIYFYRPSKVMGGPNEIIVGTFVPDEVIVELRNGYWYKSDYVYTGQREFVTGIFSINEKKLNVNIEPGKTYYFRCSIMKGMGMQAQIEVVDEETASREMNGLKEQKIPKK
jgi:hypothetical protein